MREDLAAFFGDFAETVTLINGCTFRGIVDSTFVAVGDEVAGVESSAISLICKTADVTDVEHGTVVEIAEDQYTVRGIQPDGTGVTVLRLERV